MSANEIQVLQAKSGLVKLFGWWATVGWTVCQRGEAEQQQMDMDAVWILYVVLWRKHVAVTSMENEEPSQSL